MPPHIAEMQDRVFVPDTEISGFAQAETSDSEWNAAVARVFERQFCDLTIKANLRRAIILRIYFTPISRSIRATHSVGFFRISLPQNLITFQP